MKKNIIVANTFYKRLKGLMFKKQSEYILLIPKVNKIHTFGMKFNLDLIIIDENNIIREIICNVKPNKFIFIKRARKKTSILEIPSYFNYKYQLNVNYLNIFN